MTDPDDPFAAARRFIDDDPDPETRAELAALVDAGATAEIHDRMSGFLEFGTAGLRGLVGAGSNRMNRAVVLRATRGLADYLLDRVLDARSLPVVVGYDGRLTSRRFAEDTVGVLAAAGIHVRYFEAEAPTPLVAYAARQLGAAAAVVITASHNPPEYNGYKVFGADAAQIAPPVDGEIAARIARVGPAREVRCLADAMAGGTELAEPLPATLFARYLAEVDALRPGPDLQRDLRIVYTPLHGVGWRFVKEAFERAGYPAPQVVEAQAQPDGRFPTLEFPNPEEPGALDLALALAKDVDAELVIANDPDADRLSVCVPMPSGRFVQLTGNQVGLLLADFLLARAPKQPTPLVVSTVVSSPMLESLAAHYGGRCERTLTGFKWIWAAGLALGSSGGHRFVFGYEEALGYSVPVVRDKDGLSAALLFADLAQSCKAAGQSVRERFDELCRQHGLWVSCPRTVVRKGAEGQVEIADAMDRLRRQPPKVLAGREVARVTDYAEGAADRPRWLPATNLIDLEFEDGSRVFVRPSGTEPKLKLYTELHVPLTAADSVREREAAAYEQAELLSGTVAQYVGLN